VTEDRNSPGGNGNSSSPSNLRYFLLGGIVLLLGIYWYSWANVYELDYPQLKQLVVGSSRTTYDGSLADKAVGLEVAEGTENQLETIRYSRLRDVQLGEKVVWAVADRQVISGPEQQDESSEVQLRVNRVNSEESKNKLTALLDQHNIKYEGANESGLARIWPFLLIMGAVLLMLVLALKRMGTGSAMQFGRSRGRLLAQQDLETTFGDVAGIEEAVEEIREVVDFLKSPERYQRLGGRIPKGVLLVGPPGTGKTLLAKAIAGEADVPFFSMSGSDFVEMFVGVGAARVRDMFQQAESKAPCIIFIDELDALGKTRSGSAVNNHDEREQTLNALLVELDGFSSNNGVIVVAATNRPETLDQALLRPGRFDRQILVDRPDVLGRQQILKVHVKTVKLDESVDLGQIASITPGCVGADLANLVNEAALLAARRELDAVGMEEFNESVERVTAGLQKKQRVMNKSEKRRVAYHESGHALVAFSLPDTDPVHKVSIIPRGFAALGYMLQRPEGDRYLMTQTELECRIHVLLAGTVSEELVFDDISTGASNDLERATSIARSMVMEYGMSQLGRVNYRQASQSLFLATGDEDSLRSSHSEKTSQQIDEQVKLIIDNSLETVRGILQSRYQALEAIALRLFEIESIDADELTQLVEDNSPGPWVVSGTEQRERSPTELEATVAVAKPTDVRQDSSRG
jgi:cell division protease FtsH